MRASTLLCAAASAVIASAADTQFVVNNFSLTCRSTYDCTCSFTTYFEGPGAGRTASWECQPDAGTDNYQSCTQQGGGDGNPSISSVLQILRDRYQLRIMSLKQPADVYDNAAYELWYGVAALKADGSDLKSFTMAASTSEPPDVI